MRILVRVILALLALVVVAAIVLALTLPGLVASEGVRARVEQAGRDATGRDVSYETLSFGLFPPRLVVREPRVLAEDQTVLFEARDVALEVELLPLLRRTLVVDSLRVNGATARLVRTEDGIEHPFRGPEEEDEGPSEPGGTPSDEGEGFALELRELGLRDATVLLEDRVVSPPVTWELRELDLSASGESLEAPIDFDLAGALASGGSVRARGRGQRKGDFRADFTLDAIRLDATAPYLSEGQRAAGAATGTLAVAGGSGRRASFGLDVTVEDGEVELDEVALRGRFDVKADLLAADGEGGLPEGSFEIDATEAAVDYGASFRKPPGQAAVATGRIVPVRQGEVRLEDTRIRIKNFEADLHLETGARTRATIHAAPFRVDGWEDTLPALADLAPRGTLALPELRVTTAPLALAGTVEVPELVVAGPEGQDLTLAGRFVGAGDGLRSEGLVATLAGQRLPLDVTLRGLAGEPRVAVRGAARGLDSGALVSAFGGSRETLDGPLRLDLDLAAPVGAEEGLVPALTGTVAFGIAPGRLRGVSVLRSTFEELGSAGEAALLAGKLRGGRDLQRFYDDRFESLDGSFALGGGRARTDDLRLVYRNYTVDLRGTLALADMALDLTGKLTIDEEIDETLAKQGDAAEPAPGRGRQRVIPLARVTGTAAAPRVALSSDAVLTFAALYATERRREKWEREIDEAIGEGSGRQVLDALDDILGGGKP